MIPETPGLACFPLPVPRTSFSDNSQGLGGRVSWPLDNAKCPENTATNDSTDRWLSPRQHHGSPPGVTSRRPGRYVDLGHPARSDHGDSVVRVGDHDRIEPFCRRGAGVLGSASPSVSTTPPAPDEKACGSNAWRTSGDNNCRVSSRRSPGRASQRFVVITGHGGPRPRMQAPERLNKRWMAPYQTALVAVPPGSAGPNARPIIVPSDLAQPAPERRVCAHRWLPPVNAESVGLREAAASPASAFTSGRWTGRRGAVLWGIRGARLRRLSSGRRGVGARCYRAAPASRVSRAALARRRQNPA